VINGNIINLNTDMSMNTKRNTLPALSI